VVGEASSFLHVDINAGHFLIKAKCPFER